MTSIEYDTAADTMTHTELIQRVRAARGLQKLRYVRDPRDRALLESLYYVANRNQKDPRILADLAKLDAEKAEQDMRHLASRALAGKLGPDAREAANRLLPMDRYGRRQMDPMMMKTLQTTLRELRHGPDEINTGFQNTLEPPRDANEPDF